MKYLGLDYGEAKVGLALGDDAAKVATPLETVKNQGWPRLIKIIAELCQQEKIERIVLGWPTNQQAGSSEQLKRIENFGQQLQTACGLEVIFQDERLTTAQAKKLAGEARDDEVAAMLILQAYFDRHNPAD